MVNQDKDNNCTRNRSNGVGPIGLIRSCNNYGRSCVEDLYWCSRCSQHLNTSSPALRISKMLGYISHLSVYTYIHLSASATACSIAASIIHVHSLASVVAWPQTKIIRARLLSVCCLVITTCLGGAVVERIGLVIERSLVRLPTGALSR